MDRIKYKGKPKSRNNVGDSSGCISMQNIEANITSKIHVSDTMRYSCLQLQSVEFQQYLSDLDLAEEKCWSIRRLWSTKLLKQLKQHEDSDFLLFSKILLLKIIAESASLEFDDVNQGNLLYVKQLVGKDENVSLITSEYHVAENYKDRSSQSCYMVTFCRKLAAYIAGSVEKKDIVAIWGTPPAKRCHRGMLIRADSTENDSITVVIFRPPNCSSRYSLDRPIEKIEIEGVEEFEVTTKETGAKAGCIEIKYTPLPSVVSTVASEITIRDEVENPDTALDSNPLTPSCPSDNDGSEGSTVEYFPIS